MESDEMEVAIEREGAQPVITTLGYQSGETGTMLRFTDIVFPVKRNSAKSENNRSMKTPSGGVVANFAIELDGHALFRKSLRAPKKGLLITNNGKTQFFYGLYVRVNAVT